MSIKTIMRIPGIYAEKLPVYLILFVTSRCNYRCRMCFYWRHIDKPDKNELTLGEIEKISKNFGRLLQLSLTGGEPFLRDDLADIVRLFVKNNRPVHVSIPTNASEPGRILRLTGKILSENPGTYFRVPLSMDGLYGKHDGIRGQKGAFEQLLASYNALLPLKKRFPNFALDINITCSPYNQNEMGEIIDFVSGNIECDNLSITLARGELRDGSAAAVSVRAYEEAVARLVQMKKKRGRTTVSRMLAPLFEHTSEIILKILKNKKMVLPCLAGKRIIIIDEEGAVFPCEIMGQELGRLRDAGYDISEVLNRKRAKEILMQIKQPGCFCTFECAIAVSAAFNPASYPVLASKVIRNILFK